MKGLADEAGTTALRCQRVRRPRRSNLWMAVIREHLAAKGLGLHNDLQNEHSIVGNHPVVLRFRDFGTPAQKAEFIPGLLARKLRVPFGLTEPNHGSDATHMETRGVREVRDGVPGWRIDGEKMWITGMHVASHCALFCRTAVTTARRAASAASWCPRTRLASRSTSTVDVQHADRPSAADARQRLGARGRAVRGGRPRPATRPGVRAREPHPPGGRLAGCRCLLHRGDVKYARVRKPFGEALAKNQAIQFPLVELATQAEMLRQLIRKTAWEMDRIPHPEVERTMSDKVSMCNYWANRLL